MQRCRLPSALISHQRCVAGQTDIPCSLPQRLAASIAIIGPLAGPQVPIGSGRHNRLMRRTQAHRAVLVVLLVMALIVSRGWSVMDQYYRIGTRLWSFSDSGVTKPFVHDPPRGGMCTGGLLEDLERVRVAMPSLFTAGTGAPRTKVSVSCAAECSLGQPFTAAYDVRFGPRPVTQTRPTKSPLSAVCRM